MAKDEFDMDFDFEKEYGFDPNAFLSEDEGEDIDFSEFGAERFDEPVSGGSGDDLSDFDLSDLGLGDLGISEDEDLAGMDFDMGDFGLTEADGEDLLASGDGEDIDFTGFDPDSFDFSGAAGDAPASYGEDPDFLLASEERDHGPEFISSGRRPAPAYREDEDFDNTDFDESDFANAVYGGSADRYAPESVSEVPAYEQPVYEQPAYEQAPEQEAPNDQPEDQNPQEDFDEPEQPALTLRPRRERKPPKPPKAPKPKKEKTGPSFLDKVLAYYLAPLKEEQAPQDPNNPRRRRRKRTKMQLFKEVYLPPIIAGVTLLLILVFVIGSISNAIQQKKLDNEQAMRESQSKAEEEARMEEEANAIIQEAERLAMGYDYDGAITVLQSYSGEMTQEMNEKVAEYANTKSHLVEWKDYSSIPNLSFHVLIADPGRAFADKDLGGQYNRNFVTIDEFSKILEQLYKGGYVLVDFYSFTETNTGLDGSANFFTKPIALPEGKKPVMITETMVNYFGYMVDSNDDGEPDAGGAGFAYRLVVDENGGIRAQMVDANGQTQTGNFDLVPILEDFIKEHPDFVYQGARATLAVTGSEGVFGYRTNTSYISSVSQAYYDEQVAGAKEVVQKLRDLGYTIACYTYDNVAYGDKSATQIQADMKEWANQITPVIGEVEILVYARTSDIGDYSGAKFQVLFDCGFRFFVKHGSEPYAEINNTYVRQSRLMVTGENMAWNSNQFSDLFDCAAILNNQRGNVPKG